ncbi:hypothetical protein M514_24667 [Trichuris suis]|uniref:Uncharacterized protein n=1 Tax=Trichuris suis TaxID=68888 RepID=A0A085N146_9BILA|nr:hypothetical protein M514_28476 [Trichuris suis]KFD63192.1 hypothetical protein M514_24667 [Trichuris suis]
MGADQTNNFAEAAHRRIRREFRGDHPTLWKFIDGLRRVQAGRDQHYEEYIGGDEPPHKRLKYVRTDNRILARRLDHENLTEYLRGITHNFSMPD